MSNYETWARRYFGPDAEQMINPLNAEAIRCRDAWQDGWKVARREAGEAIRFFVMLLALAGISFGLGWLIGHHA